MRKVVATLFCSVDGYATGRGPEDMDWAVTHQGPQTLQLGIDAIRGIDLMVLGRVTYEMFAAYWPTASPEVEGDFTELVNRTPKMVFSTTLDEPLGWQNTRLNRGDVAAELPKLSSSPARTSGSGAVSRWCGRCCGRGCSTACGCRSIRSRSAPPGTKPVFEGFDRTPLELVDSRVLDGQVVLLDYQAASAAGT
jgi:dihydrofolate reductase